MAKNTRDKHKKAEIRERRHLANKKVDARDVIYRKRPPARTFGPKYSSLVPDILAAQNSEEERNMVAEFSKH